MVGALGKQIVTPHMSACCGFIIWHSPQDGFSDFLKVFPNRCQDVLLPEVKLYLCLHTLAKSDSSRAPSQTHHTDPGTSAQHDAARREFFGNKIESIIMSHQKHVTTDCTDV